MNQRSRELEALRILGLILASGWCTTPEVCAAPPPIRDGLNVEFYSDTKFTNLVATRVDPNIECLFLTGSPIAGVPVDFFSIRWKGWIRAPRSGRYKLVFRADDGVRLWIDGKLLIDWWNGGLHTHEASIELSDSSHEIKVEYFEGPGDAVIAMLWQPVGGGRLHVIPPEAFSPDQASAEAKDDRQSGKRTKTGLVAEYFDKSFSKRVAVGHIPRAEALWSTGSPQWNVPPDGSAIYHGFLAPPVSGEYRLIGWADDRMRLWVDDQLVLDSHLKSQLAVVSLDADKPSKIRIAFTDVGGPGGFFVHWILPLSSTETCIPPKCLFQSRDALP